MADENSSRYIQVMQPDRERLSSLLDACKGFSRTMAQYAQETGINPSTLSRILNQKIVNPLPLETLLSIYEHRVLTLGLSFDELVRANGMRDKKEFQEERAKELQYNDPWDKMDRKKEIRRIILDNLLFRGVATQISPRPARFENSEDEGVRSDWDFIPQTDFVINTIEQGISLEWDFYCYAKALNENASDEDILDMVYSIVNMKMAFFLQDCWESALLKGVKSSFLFFDERVFDAFVKQMRKAPIHTEVSAILVDYNTAKVTKEEWVRAVDQDKISVFSMPLMLEGREANVKITGAFSE